MDMLFLTGNWDTKKAGIESAMLTRCRLFQAHHAPFHILTCAYSTHLHREIHLDHFKDSEVINLYDFFAKDVQTPSRPLTLQMYQATLDPRMQIQATDLLHYNVYYQNALQQTILLDEQTQNISEVCFYNENNTLYQHDYYDDRGWLGERVLIDDIGMIRANIYYNAHHQCYLKAFYQLAPRVDKQNVNRITAYCVGLPNEQKHWFYSEYTLETYFLECLLRQFHQNQHAVALIIDRTNEHGEPALKIQVPCVKYAYLHSDHVNTHQNTNHSVLNCNYAYTLNHAGQLDGVCMATQAQYDVFNARYHDYVKSFLVPVGIAEILKPLPYAPRFKRQQIIEVARLATEKQQTHLVLAFNAICHEFPHATLHFYGYANDNYDEQVKKLIQQYQLQDRVFIHPFTREISKCYDEACIACIPSSTEGFGLAIMESLAHGLPTITYDVLYGAKEMIVNGKNGYRATPNNDWQALVAPLRKLLSNESLGAKMSQSAYQSVKPYYPQNVWQDWQKLINHAQATYQKLQPLWQYYDQHIPVREEHLG